MAEDAQSKNRQFKIYKTKKLIFSGAELCGWVALHIFFAPESTEVERKQVLYTTVKKLLDHGFIRIIPGQTSFDKSIPIDPQVELECPVGLEIKYQINVIKVIELHRIIRFLIFHFIFLHRKKNYYLELNKNFKL